MGAAMITPQPLKPSKTVSLFFKAAKTIGLAKPSNGFAIINTQAS